MKSTAALAVLAASAAALASPAGRRRLRALAGRAQRMGGHDIGKARAILDLTREWAHDAVETTVSSAGRGILAGTARA